jgi:UDP-N-acetylglucosamine/UDP-N-acetylgalactosamine diphosphorylase
MKVVEYSELPPTLAEIENDHGRLLFGAANICNHFFTLKFIKETVFPSLIQSYHLAKKKIPYYDFNSKTIVIPEEPNGYKLELFIFDVFPLASPGEWLVFEVDREDEFAPVKVFDLKDKKFFTFILSLHRMHLLILLTVPIQLVPYFQVVNYSH